ncbi:DUF2817 domain-containing protein [bacterium]|nr:MAG: DUF2817 domain-containing protein [bacterium]
MLRQKISSACKKIGSYPKKYTIGGTSFVLVLLVSIISLWPQTIQYSYNGQSCISQPQLASGLLKSVHSSDFRLQAEGDMLVGGVSVVSSKICVAALTAPSQGSHTITLSLLGLPIGRQYVIKVPPAPVASVSPLDQPIPVTKSLDLPLTQTDGIFKYKLLIDTQTIACENFDKKVRCDIKKLDLDQGKAYKVELSRHFSDKKVATLASKDVMTLSATTVKDSSIKGDEMVFSKPKDMQIKLDKEILSAKAILTRADGNQKKIEVKAVPTKDTIALTWSDELDRSATYSLTLDSVVAKDGSSLVDPYNVQFKTSGGPKVTGVSTPRTGIALGTTVVVSFDQPLSDAQDITKLVTLGGGAAILRKQGNQLRISLAGVPKCGDFSIKLSPELQSNFDIAGNSTWDFNGRTICHTVSTIGYSAKGRAINAYYFGSGGAAVVYTGAIHGNEVSTKSLMDKWIADLEVNARSIPADLTVVVVPIINPDGYAAGTRTNGNNIDLNRNFGTNDWKKDITTVTNAPFPGGGGDAPMSQPETKAIASLVSRVGARLVLSYHSIGGVLAANQAGNSPSYARTYSSLSGYSNKTGSATTFEYAVSGTADDYYGEKLGVPSVLIELGSHTYHQFERNQKAMWAMLK